jgi:YD repeat-containing protein
MRPEVAPIRLRNPNAYVYTFQYDAAGRRTTLLDSTGITRVYQCDSVGRLTTQVDSNSGGTALVTFVDGYDTVGNRTSRVKDAVATTWACDAVYRLTGQNIAATYVYWPDGEVQSHTGPGARTTELARTDGPARPCRRR